MNNRGPCPGCDKCKRLISDLKQQIDELVSFFDHEHRMIAIENGVHIVSFPSGKPTIDAIQGVVADYFHVTVDGLRSKKRTQRLSFCRQVAMYLCRKLTTISFPLIGASFKRDHTTVMYACNLIAKRMTTDVAFKMTIEKIEKVLGADTSRVALPQAGEETNLAALAVGTTVVEEGLRNGEVRRN